MYVILYYLERYVKYVMFFSELYYIWVVVQCDSKNRKKR